MKKCLLVTFDGIDRNFGSIIQSNNTYKFLSIFYDVEYTLIYKKYNIYPSLYDKFDIIFLGGDQILCVPFYTEKIHQYVSLCKSKILQFGSSFGCLYSGNDKKVTKEYNYLISRIKENKIKLAVRETNDEITEKYNLENFHVCDPALLLGLEFSINIPILFINMSSFSIGISFIFVLGTSNSS